MTIRGSLARGRVRLLRSWWTLLLPVGAVAFLMLWYFCSGWVAALGAVGSLGCIAILTLVATIHGSQLADGLDAEPDPGSDAESGGDDHAG